jgi:asparagine synthase (glutamine-hydrolysing)
MRQVINKGLGDFLIVVSQAPVTDWSGRVHSMSWPRIGATHTELVIENSLPQVKVACQGAVSIVHHFRGLTVELAHTLGDVAVDEFMQQSNAFTPLRGKFVRVEVNAQSLQVLAFTDAMRQVPLYYFWSSRLCVVATDLRLIAQLPGVDLNISMQSIYHYLNFSYIPTPYTIYEEVKKVPAGHKLALCPGKEPVLERYWQPCYPEDLSLSEPELIATTRNAIESTVGCYGKEASAWGTFLSGGTDSSTITGILAKHVGPELVHAYSIGFPVAGFDELQYAEIAAHAFGIHHHTRRINEKDTLQVIDTLLEAYDEPFGNSSAVPTFYCAQMAALNGHDTLIAGDGGDEIFGGNERYAKDFYFRQYYQLPTFIKWAGSTACRLLAPVDRRFVNRIKNFIYRASLPNPERFYTDDSFASECFKALLPEYVRTQVDQGSSLQILDRHFSASTAVSELHRLMYIDLQMAIADNDLLKVNRAAKVAGVSVLYPYLSPDLVQFMGRIPAWMKVKGAQKRYLFKRAVRHILPEVIRKKKKQGFGLPVGEWFRQVPEFRALLFDNLLSHGSLERGYFNRNFIQSLIDRHDKGVWEYTRALWLLLMLELWHQKYVDGTRGQ